MITDLLHRPIRAAATRHGLAPAIVAATVHVESGGRRHAWRPEPAYRYLVDCRTGKPFRTLTAAEQVSEIPPKDFPFLGDSRAAEWWGQQASWGLMQVVGGPARERGFRGTDFPELCEIELGLEYGCAQLAWFVKRYGPGLDSNAAFNAGSPRRVAGGAYENQEYVDRITAALRLYQGV
ncbi:MAG TPA: transglycosylase [Candidatus Rokubacteria bacterium]|nr:transglycosylase [Candidatus Rokubacteria bacterium]